MYGGNKEIKTLKDEFKIINDRKESRWIWDGFSDYLKSVNIENKINKILIVYMSGDDFTVKVFFDDVINELKQNELILHHDGNTFYSLHPILKYREELIKPTVPKNITIRKEDYVISTKNRITGKRNYYTNSSGQKILHGGWISFFKNGKVKEKRQYSYGKPHGNWKEWYEGGSIYSVKSFVEGKWHGDYIIYYKTGKPSTITKYDHGVLNGTSTYFHRNSAVRLTGKYVDGMKNGQWEGYNEKGIKVLSIRYSNGIKEKETTFYDDGELKSEYFPNGIGDVDDPIRLIYTDSGKLFRKIVFHQSSAIGYLLDKNGKFIEAGPFQVVTNKRKLSNGEIVSEQYYIAFERERIEHGTYASWVNGIKIWEKRYKHGEMIEYINYDDNQAIKIFFRDGIRYKRIDWFTSDGKNVEVKTLRYNIYERWSLERIDIKRITIANSDFSKVIDKLEDILTTK